MYKFSIVFVEDNPPILQPFQVCGLLIDKAASTQGSESSSAQPVISLQSSVCICSCGKFIMHDYHQHSGSRTSTQTTGMRQDQQPKAEVGKQTLKVYCLLACPRFYVYRTAINDTPLPRCLYCANMSIKKTCITWLWYLFPQVNYMLFRVIWE